MSASATRTAAASVLAALGDDWIKSDFPFFERHKPLVNRGSQATEVAAKV
jgi:hypothetical protein